MPICTRCEAIAKAFGTCPSCDSPIGTLAADRPDPEPPCLEPGTTIAGHRIESLLKHHGRRRAYLARAADGTLVVVKEVCLLGERKRD